MVNPQIRLIAVLLRVRLRVYVRRKMKGETARFQNNLILAEKQTAWRKEENSFKPCRRGQGPETSRKKGKKKGREALTGLARGS